MKHLSKIMTILTAVLLSGMFQSASAQDDDDDLYYSPARAREQARREAERAQAQANAAGLGSADLYTVTTSKPLNMDVDTYNRRTQNTSNQTTLSAPQRDAFSATRRIERFHNPEIVSGSGDTTLMDYYYSTPDEKTVNVYVINEVTGNGGYSNPYYNNYYNPYYNYYNPYYNNWYGWNSFWGPSLSWSWNFGPIYGGWGWNPWYDPFWGSCWGWSSCWYPHYHPVHNVHWGYNRPGATRPHPQPTNGYRPNTRPGNNRYPGYNQNRPGQNWRPGNATLSGQSWRPGNMGRPTDTPNSSTRPGTVSGTSNNDNRGRNHYNTGTSNSGNRNNVTQTTNRNNTNTNTYTRPGNSGRSNGNNSGSYRSPGSGSRSTGGGSRGTGGGGGGGRGRGRGR